MLIPHSKNYSWDAGHDFKTDMFNTTKKNTIPDLKLYDLFIYSNIDICLIRNFKCVYVG